MNELARAPRATALSDDPDWWRGAVVYQIYPRSFQDSNGDGVGDLPGITARLPHIALLGADAIWISPFFRSPQDDFGYDVSDYREVDPRFGTLADFDRLLEAAHGLGLRVIVDLVLSHTSDRHAWFAESRSSRSNLRADWYVWAEAKPDGTAPNNWLSVFGGPAWEWDTRRRQYYLHNFLASQPDLNYHNAQVVEAMLDVARFWLDRGVDGFRLDAVNFCFHDPELRDNPPCPPGTTVNSVQESNPYARQIHLYDKDRPENLAFLERLRVLMNRYRNTTLVGEIGSDRDVHALSAAYTERDRRLHMTYSFELLGKRCDASLIRQAVSAMDAGIGTGWPAWALSNHDVARVVTRWFPGVPPAQVAPMLVALVASLRGTVFLYQGEELGLPEADVPFELLQDPYGKRFWPEFKGRDGCRTPMPWERDNRTGAFTTGEPWLPVPPEHVAQAVAAQAADPESVLARVRRFLHWRREQPALRKGSITFLDVPEPALAFVRSDDRGSMLCAFNLGAAPLDLALPEAVSAHPREDSGFGGSVRAGRLSLAPFDALFASL